MSLLGETPPILVIGVVTGAATLFGGGLALRFQPALGLLLGFGAGAVIGVALFDLLPEALSLSRERLDPLTITSLVGLGFAAYLALDRLVLARPATGGLRPHFAPGSLTLHSLMDGLGIGLAFHVSIAAGTVVAVAVLAHDFLDGANTVTLSLGSGSAARTARRWLLADAAAPFLGIALARVVSVPTLGLALLLALFAGFFLFIGAAELLPRSQRERPQTSTVLATAFGLAFIFLVVRLSALA